MGPRRSREIDFRRPKAVSEVIGDALRCYARHPLLFAEITLAVVMPYALVVYLAAHDGLLGQRHANASAGLIVVLLDVLLVGPLISALHIHALTEIAQRREPRLLDVFSRGLRVLPVVAAAQIVASLGVGLGLVAFIAPGVFLYARWGVVAQAAAVDRVDWRNALRRSAELAAGSYWHVLGVLFTVGVFNALLDGAVGALVAPSATGVQVLVGIAAETLTLSLGALTGAMLFFDLRARQATRAPT
ncbi:MAG: hypothetical protein WCB67_10670 [Solirubrobacteraceae bacterium]